MEYTSLKQQLADKGYAITKPLFNAVEIDAILRHVAEVDPAKPTFRKTTDLFAIRQFLKEVPAVQPLLFKPAFNALVEELVGKNAFLVKSIYFDKPEQSNWFVAYHQDLTISVDQKIDRKGFGPWTVKQNQFAVQPPLTILENNLTIRIHLDDTTESNVALKVIPGSHCKGVYRPEAIDWQQETEEICPVELGAVMLMKPLLLHASNRTTNQQRRRVIHLEFSNEALPKPLQWSEQCFPF